MKDNLQGGSTPEIQFIVNGKPVTDEIDIKTFRKCHAHLVDLWVSNFPRMRFIQPHLRNEHAVLLKRMDVALDDLIDWTEDLIKKADERRKNG